MFTACVNHYFSCEYVILHELGVTKDGETVDELTHFHGDKTEDIYRSKTDKVLIQVCYRSETFSGRNIQILYRAKSKSLFL